MSKDVFLSVGRIFTPEQEAFVSAIEQYLIANDLKPRTVGRTDFSSMQPLKFIEQLMNQCYGTIIIAFERIIIQEGLEKRGSPDEKPIQNSILPTVWNQIEAAMAYTLHHPILVIVQHGMRSEGLLETGYDWYVQWVNLDPQILSGREFTGVFADWKSRVEDYQKVKDLQRAQQEAKLANAAAEPGVDNNQIKSITGMDIGSEISLLEGIFKQKQNESKSSFAFALGAGALGFLVILGGIVTAFLGSTQIAVVTSAAGIVSEVAASIIFLQHRQARKSLDEVEADLLRMRNLSRALQIAITASISQDEREKQIKSILDALMKRSA